MYIFLTDVCCNEKLSQKMWGNPIRFILFFHISSLLENSEEDDNFLWALSQQGAVIFEEGLLILLLLIVHLYVHV